VVSYWQHDKEATFPSLASVTACKGVTLFGKQLFLNYLSDLKKNLTFSERRHIGLSHGILQISLLYYGVM
jgi:hypothetical protein